MITLNLDAKTMAEKSIKEFLESNASEPLAEKINNGVRIAKNGKELINKKTLETFMKYACEEAQKQAGKGKRYGCVHHDDVFAWAIHYFEEDTIEGTLYNLDGSEYKIISAAEPQKVNNKPTVAAPPKPTAISMFDIVQEKKLENFETQESATLDEHDDNDDDEIDEDEPKESEPAQPKIPSFIFDLFGDALKIEVSK
jgi:hypothetical protein